ncbi:hypothetical protein ASD89_12195 [Caulobacter sp. Root656]|nr:hypothetical protein ASD89_12195 [Caulobacter sp. Root656]
MATAFLLALALIAQDAPVSTAPTASAPPPRTQPAATAPTDDYGYVGWCYGALGGYVELYDKVMPEVTRIEKTFPGPDGFNAAMKEYPAMRAQAKKDLATYRSAIVAAEKASPRPISEYGAAAIKKGHSVWTGADQIDKARLAQVWMSWSPPSDCDTRAKTLETKSNLFGQALNYNVKKDAVPAVETPTPEPTSSPADTTAPAAEPEAPPPAPVAEAPVAGTPMAETPVASAPVKTPAATKPKGQSTTKKTAAALPPIGAKPAAMPIAAKGEIIIDPNDPKPCAGSLVPAKRGGKNVLICKAD